MSRQVKLFLKVLCTLIFLGVVAYQTPLGDLVGVLSRANWGLVFLAGLMNLVAALLSIMRWRIIVSDFVLDPGLKRLSQITFIGYFFNLFLPSGIGGDFVRAYYLSRETQAGMSTALMTLLLDRAAGLLALLMISCVAVLFRPLEIRGVPIIYVLAAITACFILGVVLIFSSFWHGLLSRLLIRIGRSDVETRIELLVEGLRRFRVNRGGVIKVIVLSFAIQSSVVLMMWVAAQAIYIQASLWTFFLFIPLVNLTIMIPIAISGLGLRELVYLMLFSEVGVPSARAVSLSLLNFTVLFFTAFPGAILYSAYKRRMDIPMETKLDELGEP